MSNRDKEKVAEQIAAMARGPLSDHTSSYIDVNAQEFHDALKSTLRKPTENPLNDDKIRQLIGLTSPRK